MKRVSYMAGVALTFATTISFAQSSYLRDVSGRVISVEAYTEVKGSPYLSDSWNKGTVKFANGSTLKDVDLKYDMVNGQLLFKKPEEQDVVMSFSDPVEEFLLTDNNGRNRDFVKDKSSNGSAGTTFYEILYNGGTKLAKQTKKLISEQSQYGSASKTKVIEERIFYYLIAPTGEKFQVQKDKKAVIEAMGAKKDNIAAYINKERLNLKNESDIIKLAEYYNTLK